MRAFRPLAPQARQRACPRSGLVASLRPPLRGTNMPARCFGCPAPSRDVGRATLSTSPVGAGRGVAMRRKGERPARRLSRPIFQYLPVLAPCPPPTVPRAPTVFLLGHPGTHPARLPHPASSAWPALKETEWAFSALPALPLCLAFTLTFATSACRTPPRPQLFTPRAPRASLAVLSVKPPLRHAATRMTGYTLSQE